MQWGEPGHVSVLPVFQGEQLGVQRSAVWGLYMGAGATQIISTCILATHFRGFLIIN